MDDQNRQSENLQPSQPSFHPPIVVTPDSVNRSQPIVNQVSEPVLKSPMPNNDTLQTGSVQPPQIKVSSFDGTNPPVVQSFNSNIQYNKSASVKRPKKKIFLGIVIGFVVLLIICGYVYFMILPKHFDSAYLSSITTAYNKQKTQMLTVYNSLGKPIFTSNNTTQASETQDLTYINSVIQSADSNTKTLKAQDSLKLLPGTQWLSSVKNTNNQYKAMKQYITDSQTFLADYQNVHDYIVGLENIENNQLTTFTNSLSSPTTATSTAQYLSDIQSGSASLSSVITSLNALNPPTDFQQFNTTLVSDLSAMNTDLQGISSGITSNNATQVVSSSTQLGKDANTLGNFSDTNFAGNFQNNSLIHRQVLKLEAENPLGTPKPATPSATQNAYST